VTLPVILAMQSLDPELDSGHSGSPDDRALIERILSSGSTTPADLEFVRRAVEETGSIEATREAASGYIARALENLRPLPPSPYRDSLALLAEGILSRRK
jgi:geranylgeranyl pyrophosphate synthase